MEDGGTLDFQSNQSLDIDGPKGEAFKAVLIDRYDPKNKLLRLDRLVDDARLQGTGTWDPNATRPKRTDFFGGLMRICRSESVFANRAIKAEQVQSILLANNGLTNVGPVVELANAFPDLRNLDLSNNRFEDMRALEPFRGKFKQLEWLILSPNPMEIQAATIIKWFPSLRTLDDIQVDTELASTSSTIGNDLPFATIKDNFHDQGGLPNQQLKTYCLAPIAIGQALSQGSTMTTPHSRSRTTPLHPVSQPRNRPIGKLMSSKVETSRRSSDLVPEFRDLRKELLKSKRLSKLSHQHDTLTSLGNHRSTALIVHQYPECLTRTTAARAELEGSRSISMARSMR